jgi:hypothetical protein
MTLTSKAGRAGPLGPREQACVWTRVFRHSSLFFAATIGILHTNESVGGIMTEDPRLSRPSARISAAVRSNEPKRKIYRVGPKLEPT